MPLSASGPRGAEELPLWKQRKEDGRAGAAVAAGGDPETRFSVSVRKRPMEHEQREAEREHGRYMERRAGDQGRARGGGVARLGEDGAGACGMLRRHGHGRGVQRHDGRGERELGQVGGGMYS